MPNGCMPGGNCKYSHEDPKSGSVPKGKPKGKDAPPKGTGGPLAKAVVALVAAASLCLPTAGSGPEYSVAWAQTLLQVGISVPIKGCWARDSFFSVSVLPSCDG